MGALDADATSMAHATNKRERRSRSKQPQRDMKRRNALAQPRASLPKKPPKPRIIADVVRMAERVKLYDEALAEWKACMEQHRGHTRSRDQVRNAAWKAAKRESQAAAEAAARLPLTVNEHWWRCMPNPALLAPIAEMIATLHWSKVPGAHVWTSTLGAERAARLQVLGYGGTRKLELDPALIAQLYAGGSGPDGARLPCMCPPAPPPEPPYSIFNPSPCALAREAREDAGENPFSAGSRRRRLQAIREWEIGTKNGGMSYMMYQRIHGTTCHVCQGEPFIRSVHDWKSSRSCSGCYCPHSWDAEEHRQTLLACPNNL